MTPPSPLLYLKLLLSSLGGPEAPSRLCVCQCVCVVRVTQPSMQRAFADSPFQLSHLHPRVTVLLFKTICKNVQIKMEPENKGEGYCDYSDAMM